MRGIGLAGIFVTLLAAGDDSGFPPRAKPSDYPAQETIKTAVIAAAIVPAEQVRKIFSADIGKGYMVVEVAIYPQDGVRFDIDPMDFALKIGDQFIHPEKPRDVAIPWPDKGAPHTNSGPGPNVTTDTGVIVAHGPNPVTGRPQTSVGTWEGVDVSNAPRPADPAPPPRKPDQSATEDKLRAKALPEGPTSKAVAGYLYFPQYGRKKKNDPVALNYSKDDISVDLKFPK